VCYGTLNVAEHSVHRQLPSGGGFVTAMANLATTTSADCETVAAITKTSATLTDQLATREVWAKSKEAEIKRLDYGRAVIGAAAAATPAAAYVFKSYKANNDN
jgi:hypothetical protein